MSHSRLFSLSVRPDLIEFDTLKRSNAHYNLQNAFNIAEKEMGLTKLLDPEGTHTHFDKQKPFYKSVKVILSTYDLGFLFVFPLL